MNYISGKKAKSLVDKGALLIDVRTPVDYRNNPLPQSRNLPLRVLPSELLKIDRKKTIVLFGEGVESDLNMANTYAEQLGFNNVFAIRTLSDWN